MATDQVRQHASAIGTAISRMHRDHYGRGATTTRTTIVRGMVTVLMEDVYTPVEHTLIAAGQEDDVKHTRQVFQMAMGPRFCETVAEITGRKVIAFMSQVHFKPDLSLEFFVLEPNGADANGAEPRSS
jgi:uncharacterized protein YbcI